MKEILPLAVTLFLVIDILGAIPLLLVLLRNEVNPQKLIRREFLIALGIMLFFAIAGSTVLGFMGLGLYSIQISGGIILFLIALQMLFPRSNI